MAWAMPRLPARLLWGRGGGGASCHALSEAPPTSRPCPDGRGWKGTCAHLPSGVLEFSTLHHQCPPNPPRVLYTWPVLCLVGASTSCDVPATSQPQECSGTRSVPVLPPCPTDGLCPLASAAWKASWRRQHQAGPHQACS